MLEHALLLWTIGLVAIMSPGPDCFLVLRAGLCYPPRAAVATALGISTGFCVHLAYCVLGLSALLIAIPGAERALAVGGAAYLCFLGTRCIRGGTVTTASLSPEEIDGSTATTRRAFREGLLCNLTNPKVALFLIGLFSQFIAPETPPSELAFYVGMLLTQTVLYWSGLALVVGQLRRVGPVMRWAGQVERVLGALLIFAAIRLAIA